MTLHRFYMPPGQWNAGHPVLDEAGSATKTASRKYADRAMKTPGFK